MGKEFYNPTGFINSLLIIGIFAFIVFTFYVLENYGNIGYAGILGIAGCIGGLILRNRILGDTKKIVLVTFFQLLAPALTVAGILIKKSGGIMGNAAMQANLNGASPNIERTKKKNVNEVQYSCEHDILAQEFGYRNAKHASRHGVNMRKYL